jgi:hypothetical protein
MAATAQTQPALFHLQQSFESIRSRQPVTKSFSGYHTLTLSQNVARMQLHSAIPKRLRRKDGVLIFRSKEQCDISTPQTRKQRHPIHPEPPKTAQNTHHPSTPNHPLHRQQTFTHRPNHTQVPRTQIAPEHHKWFPNITLQRFQAGSSEHL